jgi:tight adherence protein C
MAETSQQTGSQPLGPRGDLVSTFRSGGRKRTGKPGQGASRGPVSRRSGTLAARVGRHFLDLGSGYAGNLLSNVQIDVIRARLLKAGFPYGLKATQFAFLKWLLMVGISFVFAAAVPLVVGVLGYQVSGPGILFVFLIGALYGFKLLDFWLSIRIRTRQTEIQLALPDMIDLITVSVEAGLGLGAAIARVAQRFPNALSEEFVRTMQEIHLGRSQAESLRDMAKRLDVPDLTTFLTSLVQAETLGLPIANVLRVQSERLRERRSQRAREQAQKAPIKMIFPLVFCIFPAIFVVILGPAALKIAESGF